MGLVVEYGVGPGYRSVLFGLYRGVSCRTGPKEQLKLGRPGGSVKGDGRAGKGGKGGKGGKDRMRVTTVQPTRDAFPLYRLSVLTALRLHNLQSVISFDTGSCLEDAR